MKLSLCVCVNFTPVSPFLSRVSPFSVSFSSVNPPLFLHKTLSFPLFFFLVFSPVTVFFPPLFSTPFFLPLFPLFFSRFPALFPQVFRLSSPQLSLVFLCFSIFLPLYLYYFPSFHPLVTGLPLVFPLSFFQYSALFPQVFRLSPSPKISQCSPPLFSSFSPPIYSRMR